ncbi:hypothetical protein Clocl_2571 [Acetivibrio clariflavus DSM 19732]|uniref:DUF116 domain-containing protein n=2 Tax=Acetivibrio clariflavus TaxID=288965 RepID=G8M0Q9_ACECE|nr:hypothetical protein Clocl_2571 [Acetivibrio clariflavus DSM 19732]
MFFMLLAFVLIYRYFTIHTYNFVLLILIVLTILILLFYMISILSIYYIYKYNGRNKIIRNFAGTGMRALLPFSIFLADIFKTKKDLLRKFYIDFNNAMVNASGRRYLPKNVLILLPHCLQYSECGYKITNNTENCRRCGRCSIGKILKIAEEREVEVCIVTGGTAARNIVKRINPELIFAVACERDLTSGIVEVGKIPVIGLINDRPNGPCYNTTVDVESLKQRLDEILEV